MTYVGRESILKLKWIKTGDILNVKALRNGRPFGTTFGNLTSYRQAVEIYERGDVSLGNVGTVDRESHLTTVL